MTVGLPSRTVLEAGSQSGLRRNENIYFGSK